MDHGYQGLILETRASGGFAAAISVVALVLDLGSNLGDPAPGTQDNTVSNGKPFSRSTPHYGHRERLPASGVARPETHHERKHANLKRTASTPSTSG